MKAKRFFSSVFYEQQSDKDKSLYLLNRDMFNSNLIINTHAHALLPLSRFSAEIVVESENHKKKMKRNFLNSNSGFRSLHCCCSGIFINEIAP
ncbi:CLUMA_CG019651, isoform A [Clunio marinus]|uniref:CLUMA_CG019651, isoform A n=1 Tax=Clunio marinus TaxID=568069 RepID=A0A1J1J2A2_9DIPT|nr:CLUMA_CG019651, isoform A [Clunio marinus]